MKILSSTSVLIFQAIHGGIFVLLDSSLGIRGTFFSVSYDKGFEGRQIKRTSQTNIGCCTKVDLGDAFFTIYGLRKKLRA